jgi:hypothetical protein
MRSLVKRPEKQKAIQLLVPLQGSIQAVCPQIVVTGFSVRRSTKKNGQAKSSLSMLQSVKK